MNSNSRNGEQPRAVLVGLDSLQGLQAARIMANHGVSVIAIAKNPKYHTCKTNVCERIIYTDTTNDELVETLRELGKTLNTKAVLYPCQDNNVLIVSRNRDVLKEWYHIVLPDPEVLEMLMDKTAFYKFAEKEGLPVPQTFMLYSREDAEQASQKLHFPCCLKPPSRPVSWTKHTKQKAFKVQNAKELLSLYDHYHSWIDSLIVQEWIEGSDANNYTCNCYFDHNGELAVTFTTKKIRQWPPGTGQACSSMECRNDAVTEATIKLFRDVNYRGLGYLEMKQDTRTRKYLIVEPNIGRPTGRSASAEAGGVELLYTMYCDALGWTLPENRHQEYREGKWIHLLRDFQSAVYYWRKGELSLNEWRKSVSGTKAYGIFSWKDPLPFLTAVKKAVPVYFSAKEREKADI